MNNELAGEFRELLAGRSLLYTVGTGLTLIVMAGVGTVQKVADQGTTGAEAAESVV
ncbi:hypothetical protein [Streptomyces huasconensis]|uniref:hypothetical protein n=1 Tax=Streptomyces huasconensis TaxID=1854574 RepID=UPI0033DC46C9